MSKASPLLVGITGGIGAGKSTVAKVFAILSVPIYYADDRAKWLMANDEGLKEKIIAAFGPASYDDQGILNRSFLAEKVFSDPANTETINGLVHPAVGNDFSQWVKQQVSPYVLKEAALLFESGSYKELNKVINVSSPLKVRVARVLMRDPHRSLEQVNAIINKQLPDEDKNEMADFVIKNTDSQMIIPQVLSIHEKLLEDAAWQ
ncbi:MAG TPA: dephospho-CoA kinase [Cyclobacteriaceae bacterium]|jgi:dephospho-CoA kinase|nr:dephospho-CoA kinase [Cyclobacteriaceae bacterium]